MRYHNITTDDMLNGYGLRTVLWVAGCTHHCKDCQNPITWDIHGGVPFEEKDKLELFQKLSKDYIDGITFSGGDPLHPCNVEPITELAKEVRTKFPNKTIWMYTGFLWDDVKTMEVMKYVDVLVDGEFEVDKRDVKLHWCGSSNQRIINVQESLKTGTVVLQEDIHPDEMDINYQEKTLCCD